MEIKVVIDKKFAFVILGAILILAGAIHGYAQSPSIFGHEFEELQGVQAKLSGDNCAVGEVVKTINFDTGEVSCIDIEASSGIDWSEPITSTIIQDKTGVYDLFFQGGTGSGNARNLALLGVVGSDKLYVNYNSEYTGGTRIGGPVTIVGSLTATGGGSGLVPCTLIGGGNGCWRTNGESGGLEDDVTICCSSGYITKVCQGNC